MIAIKRILLVEDDMMIASGLLYAMEQEGYAVTHCKDIGAARQALAGEAFDLALLDLQLPDGTGFALTDTLNSQNIPIIFLTIVDDESKIVKAFESGTADYITKPFRLRELLARIKRTLQMGGAGQTEGNGQHIVLGAVRIDTAAAKVWIGDQPVELTALEYRLLLIFAAHPAQLLTRRQILDSLWDSAGNFVEDNTLTVYVKRLREKLGGAITIETVRGLGYRVGE